MQYIEGEKNIVANALSHIPRVEIFRYEEKKDFPFNLSTLAKKQRAKNGIRPRCGSAPWRVLLLASAKWGAPLTV